VDWRCGGNPHEASAQAEDRSSGCATDPTLAAGGSVPADLGTELGEPGFAVTAVAPAPHGAGAYPDHEPTANGRTEPGPGLQEEVVARTWTASQLE
jgi:hypothetical protein